MIKVVFVCHGNICRSPMAEFIFKNMLEENGLLKKVEVCSRATSNEEIYNGVGNPVYPPARAELEKHNILCGNKRAIRLTKQDYNYYDFIICMDNANVRNSLKIFENNDEDKKVFKLLSFVGSDGEVADPWYFGRFDLTYSDISRGLEGFLNFLKTKELI